MKSFWLWDVPPREEQRSLAILFLRLFVGFIMLTHGFYKIANYATLTTAFPDPIGIGMVPSLWLAIFAEVVCSFLLILGFLTRPAAAILVINMTVAGFFAHMGDPFAQKELALMYWAIYIVLTVFGGGRYSVDWAIFTSKFDAGIKHRKNMNPFDRIMRILVSFVIWYFVLTGIVTGAWVWILVIITAPLMVTAFWGYCPAYCMLKGKCNRSDR
ncbi:MAG: DoxX family membrane protein [Bacteroidales bacterium]